MALAHAPELTFSEPVCGNRTRRRPEAPCDLFRRILGHTRAPDGNRCSPGLRAANPPGRDRRDAAGGGSQCGRGDGRFAAADFAGAVTVAPDARKPTACVIVEVHAGPAL